mgnify:CR=1 FL=1
MINEQVVFKNLSPNAIQTERRKAGIMKKKLLRPKEVVKKYPELTASEGTLANWRCQKRGPRYYKVSRGVLYDPDDIEAVLYRNPVLTLDSVEV